MNLNRAMIIGNLTRDPESRTTPTGQTVCNFSIATSTQWNNAQGQKQERTEFHPIVAWGKLAEICTQYLGKGRKVYIEGRLQTREWEAQDGSKKQRTEIVAENMIMLDRAPAGGALPGTPMTVPLPSDPSAESSSEPPMDKGIGEQEIKIEDIPF
ncbi:single-stranded DNA-binding protein [Patescibacteria group bacterium]|jgi:single-strand DNA-binding protein|nr:single-stranded DNA-binding protein [Patescibacteria group bacterium]